MNDLGEEFWLERDELLRDDEVGEIVVVTKRLKNVDDDGIHSRSYEVSDWTLTAYQNVTEEEARTRYERTGRKRSHPKPSMNPWVRKQMAEYSAIDQDQVEPSSTERDRDD